MNFMRILVYAGLAFLLAACATAEQKAIGDVFNSGALFGGVPVYKGDITRKYTVIKHLSSLRESLDGPYYQDPLSADDYIARMGEEVGADAVINYEYKTIWPKCKTMLIPLTCTRAERTSYRHGTGTAVKFLD